MVDAIKPAITLRRDVWFACVDGSSTGHGLVRFFGTILYYGMVLNRGGEVVFESCLGKHKSYLLRTYSEG